MKGRRERRGGKGGGKAVGTERSRHRDAKYLRAKRLHITRRSPAEDKETLHHPQQALEVLWRMFNAPIIPNKLRKLSLTLSLPKDNERGTSIIPVIAHTRSEWFITIYDVRARNEINPHPTTKPT